MAEKQDNIFNRHNSIWSPGLSNGSMFERLQEAGFDIRNLIRENQQYDIDEALETADKVSAAMTDHGNSYRTQDVGALAERLESATRSLHQICHQNCETNIADGNTNAGEAETLLTGAKALDSLGQSRKQIESSVLPYALAHTMTAQEEKSKRKLQALLSASRGWDNKVRVNGTFDSIGSPPEEAVKCLRWLGRGMPQDSIPESLSETRWSSRNDTHVGNGLNTMDKKEAKEVSENAEVMNPTEEPDIMAEPEVSEAAEDADNDNHISDSSSSSGEEETWSDEAYEATCPRPRSQVEQWVARQNLTVPGYGYMSHSNGIDRTQHQRPRAYTASYQALNTISEDPEGETAMEEGSCSSGAVTRDTVGNKDSEISQPDEKCIESVSTGQVGDVVSFTAVRWDSPPQPRNSSMDSASTEIDPTSQKKSE